MDMDEYYPVLGPFIIGFSGVEKWLLRILWKEAGLKPPLAQALLYGLRVAGAIDTLNRVHEAMGTAIHPTVAAAITQLATINTARNWIVHWGLDTSDPEAHIVSNNFTSHSEDSRRQISVSPDTIQEMIGDLACISMIFKCYYTGAPEHVMNRWLKQPWTYKFPQSKAARAKTPKTRDTPPRQPKPSGQ